jgi:hypothetical protein
LFAFGHWLLFLSLSESRFDCQHDGSQQGEKEGGNFHFQQVGFVETANA